MLAGRNERKLFDLADIYELERMLCYRNVERCKCRRRVYKRVRFLVDTSANNERIIAESIFVDLNAENVRKRRSAVRIVERNVDERPWLKMDDDY